MAPKGVFFEEVVREFFFSEGFLAVRGVLLRAHGNDVTDIDVWLYGRVGGSRTTGIVDAKSKRSPKAFERILWTKGLQEIAAADQAIVATTDSNPAVARFATEHGVKVITKSFIDGTTAGASLANRISLEQFVDEIKSYDFHKEDGDWLARINDAKSSLVSLSAFQSFNRAINHFRFFGDRLITRPQLEKVALRCILMCASVAVAALDIALQDLQFTDARTREETIRNGVIYGEGGSDRIRSTISRVLNLVENSIENGQVISRQISKSLETQFQNIRADIVSEYFSNPARAAELFSAARDLDRLAFSNGKIRVDIPTSTKGILGVIADFASIPRASIFQKISFESAERSSRNERDQNRLL